jgi:hypothetical protein
MSEQRTRYAEHFVEQWFGELLTSEWVFRSPQVVDGTQKEVADLLLLLRNRGILVSLKCQENPGSRSSSTLERWAGKRAREAAKQIGGALRVLRAKSVWCVHPRRGRVEFSPGMLQIIHALVLVEVSECQHISLPPDLPLSLQSIPISYLSVNDFLNLGKELRTFPDIVTYLEARLSLEETTRRSVGDERSLCTYYLLNGKSFDGCSGLPHAQAAVAASGPAISELMRRKREADQNAKFIEYIADALAERATTYAAGLSPEMAARFDDLANRRNYLMMQTELCDLRLHERSELGRCFIRLINRVSESSPPVMRYCIVPFDSKPGFIYVLISARGISRPELFQRADRLLLGARALYRKPAGMAIVDRDGEAFEFLLKEGRMHQCD